MSTKILVTDGHSRATLQLVRSFGRMGFEVHVAEKFNLTPSFFSKYTYNSFVYPDPINEKDFINSVSDYCLKNNIEQIYPVVDECLFALVKNRELFSGIKIPFTNINNLKLYRDKLLTIRQCEKLNVPHPKTFFTEKPDFLQIAKDLGFPIIIKPRVSSGSRGIEIVKSFDNFEFKYNIVKKAFGSPLIQEFIPNGGAYGTEMLLDNGKPLAHFSHYRIREYPESGGPSTYRKSIKSKLLEKISLNLLSSVNWDGPAMVEFRIDKRTGQPMLMEVNGRYWGSLDCSISSGVDFPKLHYCLAVGQTSDYPRYNSDIRSRWEIGDLLWLFSKGGSLVNHISRFLKGLRSDSFDYLKKDDPLPFVISFLEAFTFVLSKEGRKYSTARGWTDNG